MKQNLTIALLSVVATLLVVVVVQNLNHKPVLVSQLGGGSSSSVGTIGVATGGVQGGGDASAFFIYLPEKNRVAAYVLGNRNRLELRAVRNIEFDLQMNDYAMKIGRPATVAEVKNEVTGGAGN